MIPFLSIYSNVCGQDALLNSDMPNCLKNSKYAAELINRVEVWGNNYNNSIQSLFILEKRAIHTIHKADYLEHTNPLFLKSKLLKKYRT